MRVGEVIVAPGVLSNETLYTVSCIPMRAGVKRDLPGSAADGRLRSKRGSPFHLLSASMVAFQRSGSKQTFCQPVSGYHRLQIE